MILGRGDRQPTIRPPDDDGAVAPSSGNELPVVTPGRDQKLVRLTLKRRDAASAMTLVMTTTEKTKTEKDFVARLADAGEEALQRLSELPGGQKAVTAYNDLRTRVDELGKKVRGIDALEARIAKLEKDVATLKKSKAPARETPQKPTA